MGGIGMGGIGMGGMGGRGGGGGRSGGGQRSSTTPGKAPELTVRWESALPIREAELKSGDTSAPAIDEDHFAIVVLGVPRRMTDSDEKKLASEVKKHALLKREGKKDFKPSDVQVLQREDGPVFIFLFPRSTEITKADGRIEFDAQIGPLKLIEPFNVEEMVYDGKLEL